MTREELEFELMMESRDYIRIQEKKEESYLQDLLQTYTRAYKKVIKKEAQIASEKNYLVSKIKRIDDRLDSINTNLNNE